MLEKYNKKIEILNNIFKDVINKNFHISYPHFYDASSVEHTTLQCIANTFDINIKDEMDFIARELCQKPILKKSKLGTHNGIREAIFPIFGEINIKTHASDERLEPYTFEIQIKPNSTNVIDLKKAVNLIDRYKPLRDSSNGIVIIMPNGEIKTEIASLGDFNIRINSTQSLHRTLHSKSECGILLKWDLYF